MPKFLEDKLRAEYGDNPRAIYGTMNTIGAMHGNKETAKGRAMERKHEADMRRSAKPASLPAHVRSAGHPARNLGIHLHPRKGGR